MHFKKILLLIFVAPMIVYCTEEEQKSPNQQERLEKIKEFCAAVWCQMQNQVDVFIDGVAFGTVLHAAYAHSYKQKTIEEITGKSKIVLVGLSDNKSLISSNKPHASGQVAIVIDGAKQYNTLLDTQIKEYIAVTWQDIAPHLLVIGGTRLYSRYNPITCEQTQQDDMQKQLVSWTATGANFFAGNIIAYSVLSLIKLARNYACKA